MVNFNGNILTDDSLFLNHRNRGLLYGDALSETLRAKNAKTILWEDHYLKLMASMRILRMEIPMNFTMEFLEDQVLMTLHKNGLENDAALVDIFIFRDSDGKILPESNEIAFYIEVRKLNSSEYILRNSAYEVELFKDFYLSADMLSTLATNNKMLNVVGSIFAAENDLNDCLLLNHQKMVVGSLVGNLFLIVNDTVITPPLTDGCANNVMRDKIIKVLIDSDDFEFEENSISPFELQKAEELFIVNIEEGLIPITKYRKKEFATTNCKKVLEILNGMISKEIAG